MGLFISINGWSENVVPLLKQNPEKCVLLMDGYDLRCVLAHAGGPRRVHDGQARCAEPGGRAPSRRQSVSGEGGRLMVSLAAFWRPPQGRPTDPGSLLDVDPQCVGMNLDVVDIVIQVDRLADFRVGIERHEHSLDQKF